MTRKCRQCCKVRAYPSSFIGRRGVPVQMCRVCQRRYYGWDRKSAEERFATTRKGVPLPRLLRAALYRRSGNRKLGGLPASITSRDSCPPSCSFYGHGCYAEYSFLAAHWRRVGRRGRSWARFCDDVASLPDGQLWRHNEAGDLPGKGDRIDSAALWRLVWANSGRRGFTFTHKPTLTSARNQIDVAAANMSGFTVNLSADNLHEADRLHALGIAPVVVVLPSDASVRVRTPGGRRVTVCPAETRGLTCAECELCAIPTRRTIVGFRAHGQSKALVSELVRERR